MSDPILARAITWRDLRQAPSATTCSVCERPLSGDDAGDGGDDAYGCERCGSAAFHWTCWLERLATPTERATYEAGCAEREAAGAPRIDAAMLHNLTALAEALAVPLLEVVGRIQPPPGPAEQAVERLIQLCGGCQS
jgi:hypothetical protein